MNFMPSDSPEALAAHQRLDELIDRLVTLDVVTRQGVMDEDHERVAESSMAVGTLISDLTWGGIPTVLMHAIGHVTTARNEAGRLAESLISGAEALTKVSQILNDAEVPVGVCAQLMDLAVSLRESAEATMFVRVDNEGECNHD